ncbi:MAG: hypothetical protein H0T79_20515, partial [Deltaproteobacteria bacterium]|nr:hypothetical protein [Deltaproteobacteria bacterium]
MRRVGLVLPLAILMIAGTTAARADVPRGFVTASSVWRTQRVIAPRLTPQLGAYAASGLD